MFMLDTVKLASFTIIQTFFITALSKGILQDLHRLLNNPSGIVSLLATSLPAQSTFFMQLVFVRTTTTFLMEGLGIVRIIMGIARKYVGPNLTDRERRMPFLGTFGTSQHSFSVCVHVLTRRMW